MRSRYCAYVLNDAAYVLSSWHPDTRPEGLDLGDTAATRWLGLDVKRYTPVDADHAIVEFVARYRVGAGSAFRLHEISRFVRDDGRWFYVDGVLPAR